jgi:uncharacterized protein (TIGR03435 family)
MLNLNFARKAALTSIGIVALAAPIVLRAINANAQTAKAPAAHTQADNLQQDAGAGTEKPVSFDVASIKLNSSPPGGREGTAGGRVLFTEGGVVGARATVRRIIQAAYRLTEYQVSGGPGWIDSDRFDLEAKAGIRANEDQLRQMLQTLLADRFKLARHRETREMPVAFLTVGKHGPGPALHQLKDAEAAPEVKATEFGGHQAPGPTVIMRGTLQDFAVELSGPPFEVGHVVVDKTGLQGTYVGFLHWGEDGDDAISALRDEFDLKLELKKALMEILVIDRVEKPSRN